LNLDKARKYVFNSKVNIAISVLILASMVLLIIHLAIDFDVKTSRLFNSIDQIFLIIFLIEFLVKIILFRKEYFFGNFGWIDLLAVLPIFAPVIEYYIFKSNVDAMLSANALNITIVMRGLRFVRFLRILRTIRLLKLFHIIGNSTNPDEPKFSIKIPIIFSFIIFIFGYMFILYVENKLESGRTVEMMTIAKNITEDNMSLMLKINPNILIINKGFKYQRTISDKDIMAKYSLADYKRVKFNDCNVLYSVKDITGITKKLEIVMIVSIFLLMICTFLQYTIDIKKISENKPS